MPQLHQVVIAAGGQQVEGLQWPLRYVHLVLRAKVRPEDAQVVGRLMRQHVVDIALLHIPQLHVAIAGGGDEVGAVRGEGRSGDLGLVVGRGLNLPTGADVPDDQRLIIGAGGEQRRRGREADDANGAARLMCQLYHLLSGLFFWILI